ncbi:uncharacterized protein LOC121422665 [Lytechinus variegatus]|uniref:uncharacterized protein LOC121422665 n=1 Tax=Lytechinus variegatus TaxID=7654 RepID=UPI001BB28D59|nr:uncharacterized protein LOC121422665 [Lytechinus variegatus]
MSTVQKPQKVYAQKGEKQVGKIVSGEKKETTTALVCINAAGNYIPPMLIFKRVHMNNQLMKAAPPDALAGTSRTGWIIAELFTKWMGHFIKHSGASQNNKVLLILNNHESHLSIETYKLCRQNGVIMVSLPPHTSHSLQPLDVTVFSSLKVAYNEECDRFMRLHPGPRITQYEIGGLFNAAYCRVATMSKATNGFHTTGILPFNPHRFTEEDFVPVNAVMSFLESSEDENEAEVQDIDDRPSASTIQASQEKREFDPDIPGTSGSMSAFEFIRSIVDDVVDAALSKSSEESNDLEVSVIEVASFPKVLPRSKSLRKRDWAI